jgi:hypothetical protein
LARRGRPRSARAASAVIVHTKLRLYQGEDDDLIEFFSAIPLGLRASMIKRALRSGIVDDSDHEPVDETWFDDLAALVE